MAILRQLNEFVRESVVLALEPARTCAAKCTYCFATLNADQQHAARRKSLKDDSTFERILERAYSPSYDPTNFMQWGLRNRLVLGYANTVEPFQDKIQAIHLLRTLERFNIPIFLQLKGINFFDVCDYLEPFKDNSSVFVSIPTLDQRVAKRFEPGAPTIEHRLKVIDWLADHGFWTIGALSPYHENWCKDPSGLVTTLADHGVNQIFFDKLHLNERQHEIARDRTMAEMSSGRGQVWSPSAINHLRDIYETAKLNNLDFFSNGFMGTVYGFYNTVGTINPDHCFSRGTVWPYHDGNVFQELEQIFYQEDGITPVDRDFADSILLTWNDISSIIHKNIEVNQVFSYSSLMDVVPLYKKIPATWKKAIGIEKTSDCAPMIEWFRALYNNPYKHQFIHRHPWIRIAVNMDGIPYLDSDGNFISLFDPDCLERYNRHFRKVESLESFRRIEFGYEEKQDG